MMLSGCSGFGFEGGNYDNIQRALTDSGFLVIRVDSLKARGQDRCDGGAVSLEDQLRDIRAAAAYLRRRPDVRADALNVLGWSWGGRGALAAAIDGAGIQGAIAYYPYCPGLPGNATRIPTLVLFGSADNVVPLAQCERIFAASKLLTLEIYPNAHHGFDNPRLDPPREYRFGTLGYNKASATAAWSALTRFLKR